DGSQSPKGQTETEHKNGAGRSSDRLVFFSGPLSRPSWSAVDSPQSTGCRTTALRTVDCGPWTRRSFYASALQIHYYPASRPTPCPLTGSVSGGCRASLHTQQGSFLWLR